MKAAVYKKYGSPEVLQINEVVKPIIKSNQVLVKIKATAVNSGDIRLRKADPFAVRLMMGIVNPNINILGGVFAGEIVEVGELVKGFTVGDHVFGSTDMKFGAYAEYLAINSENAVIKMPSQLTFNEAASIPFGANTALHFLSKANISPGDKVLVYGASGAVGTAAVQIAKSYGAIVTTVCSKSNEDFVKTLGADVVFDYQVNDGLNNPLHFDVIIDTVNKMSIKRAEKALKINGVLILSAAGIGEMMQSMFLGKNIKVLMGMSTPNVKNLETLVQLIEERKLKPVIDKIYTLDQIREAHTYVEKGHKKGNVVIEI